MTISIEELKSQTEQFLKEKNKYQIRSPSNGTFQLISAKYKGSSVQSGEILGVISPDTNIIAECYLSPKDIGLIKENMNVKFQIDAFNYNEWGFIQGNVIDIAQDYILMENQPVFKIKCQLKSNKIKLKNGYVGVLKKGMTIQARFVVSRRSLFQLLYDNTDSWLNPDIQIEKMTKYSFFK